LLAAGDVASCDSSGDEQTANLLDKLPGTIAGLGDLVYDDGTAEEFADCYGPTWGRHKARTRPAPGNHEYNSDGAEGYYDYFGAAAGDPSRGYYSYQLGSWHVVALNSNCGEIGGCGRTSPQGRWLAEDLAANPTLCTLAYWHHPRFSSGPHGDYPPVAPLWDALHAAGADVVLVGHDHLYERFAPQAPDGTADAAGIRQFTVGTGGKALYAAERVAANSDLIIDDAFGVLELTLEPASYRWRFVTVDGIEADAGSADCH
ncbi:MAG: metallophosphoesterase family protein, partial [Candidatus Limnocylindria bacterium]